MVGHFAEQIALSFGIFHGNRQLLFHLCPSNARQEIQLGAHSLSAVSMELLTPFGLFWIRHLGRLGELCAV